MDAARAAQVRQHFQLAADGFVALVQSMDTTIWELPALGAWTVRDLTGHTTRALLTVESYFEPTTTAVAPSIVDALAYFQAASAALADPAAVAERGRQAGAALGDEPAAAVSQIAERVVRLVDGSADEALVTTPVGTMTLTAYLPTRTFELVVHSLDLAAAAGADLPSQLADSLSPCLHLAADLAAAGGHGAEVVLALTGRQPLPDGFTVV